MMLRLKAAGVNKPVRDKYPERLLAHDAICNTLGILLLKISMQTFPLDLSSLTFASCLETAQHISLSALKATSGHIFACCNVQPSR